MTGNWITLAVLTTAFFDLEIENEKLVFSIDVPPGNCLSMVAHDLLFSSPTESFSNLMICFDTFPFESLTIPMSSPRVPLVKPSEVSILLA